MEEYNIEMDQYKETLREDAEAIQTYIEELYSVRVPPPLKPTSSDLSFWKLLDVISVTVVCIHARPQTSMAKHLFHVNCKSVDVKESSWSHNCHRASALAPKPFRNWKKISVSEGKQ